MDERESVRFELDLLGRLLRNAEDSHDHVLALAVLAVAYERRERLANLERGSDAA